MILLLKQKSRGKKIKNKIIKNMYISLCALTKIWCLMDLR